MGTDATPDSSQQGVVDLDARDVARARQGDRAATERLYRRHQRRIWHLARLMTGSAQEAEDICQEVFLRALGGLERFRGEARWSTWLYRITINHVRNLRARQQTRRAVEAEPAEAGEELARPGELARRSTAELQAALAQALPRLSEGQREVLACHDVLGMTHAEIGFVLGCAVGSSKAQLHKARLRMRALLTAE